MRVPPGRNDRVRMTGIRMSRTEELEFGRDSGDALLFLHPTCWGSAVSKVSVDERSDVP